jgi:uncharacterized glyoxalase superfamily protein PhnB
MIMLATINQQDELERRMKLPRAVGGNTQGVYVVVDEVDAHCARAREAGVSLVTPLSDWDHGGRGYTCTDCEDNLWSFGTYNPWTAVHEPR